ncbi:tigger transposable element-derived protein 1-like [Cataglyphis hispanica]|uniref:tigger transposable element-derived protein 1-like n=1 Tax=Cataglyphis hispanica TaxID=1086592 RepID=UPI00218022FE|nr:tigger transposable element-derived protein 1-like [Cataglyphis hispanica]
MNNYSQKKVKRQTIPLETKILILNRLADGEGSTAVANEFKLELIQEKARHYFNQLKDLEPSSSSCSRNVTFSASNGWFAGFVQRYALHNVKIQGEAASADETAAMNYRKVLAEIIDDGGYCPDQIFNADETGLFWKKMPSRTLIAKSEKTASGFKAAKDRITLLLCSNASAWVTSAVFTTWFNDCFVPEVEKYMEEMGLPFKVLLIVDNAPGHPCIEHPNIQMVFYHQIRPALYNHWIRA